MPSIILHNHAFSYTITRKLIRSMSIRVRTRRSFSVTAPHLTPGFVITQFIKSHADWIIQNSGKVSPRRLIKGLKSLQILDQKYEISIRESLRDSVVIFKDEYKIYANTTSLAESNLRKLLDSKFRPTALSLITAEIKKLDTLYGFKYGHISVKNTTSRFGSCSSTNNLNFNWQIIFLPFPIFRHILLHELTHTIHHNHSYRFWDQLQKYDPDWHSHRQYLKSHASKHFII